MRDTSRHSNERMSSKCRSSLDEDRRANAGVAQAVARGEKRARPRGDCFVAVEPRLAMTGQRQIDATDREIDRLVYGLYGLTDQEIRIVEGTNE